MRRIFPNSVRHQSFRSTRLSLLRHYSCTITPLPPLSNRDYTVGWICALSLEVAAARAMLDEIHEKPLEQHPFDQNNYCLGRIGKHNVVIACLPAGLYGTTSAAMVADRMLFSFESVRFGLMVGIGGGVPSKESDVRLGDVVVSKPGKRFGGVVQYDFGKTVREGQFTQTGSLNKPPQVLLTAVSRLEANHMMGENKISQFLSDMVTKYPNMQQKFSYQGAHHDRLYEAAYDHVGGNNTCETCDAGRLVDRPARNRDIPMIHYGLIASGNQVMKHGVTRDRLREQLDVLCFEMEAAGLMDNFPCLVIRGVCDYADTHKNNCWQEYAAATAAAYAKELLCIIPKGGDVNTRTVTEITGGRPDFRVKFDPTSVPMISKFVGRDLEMRRLQILLPSPDSQRRKVFVLHGLGGIGKTQLAMEFARKHQDRFTAVFWLNGKTRESLVRSIASIAKQLPRDQQPSSAAGDAKDIEDTEKRAREVLTWLALEGNSNWLVIFDNVDKDNGTEARDKEAYDVETFFPPADQGSIIITTRLNRLADGGLGESLRVGKLGDEEALMLLANSARNTFIQGEDSQGEGSLGWGPGKLVRRLDGLPLAIILAGSYMGRTGICPSTYLQLYQSQWSDLQKQIGPQRQYRNGTIETTWMISYEEIKKVDEIAAKLLQLLAYFDNQDIWFGLLKHGNDDGKAPEWFCKIIAGEISFNSFIQRLLDYSMIEAKEGTDSYSMHPVVQDWCLKYLSRDQNDEFFQVNLASVGYAVPMASEKNFWVLQQRLLPHSNQILNSLQNHLQTSSSHILFHKLGILYSNQGRLAEAEAMYGRALVGYEKALGLEHMSTLGTVNNLGNLYSRQDRLTEAETMYRRALAGYERALGLEHASILGIVNNLGNLYSRQGRLAEAEDMYERALIGYRKTLVPEHMSILGTINNLGTLYSRQGRLAEAETMYRRALAGYEKALGPEHTLTLRIVSNLGTLYHVPGRLAEAKGMYQRALAGYEKALGPEHISTLRILNNLGALYSDQGRLMEAETMYQQALAGYEKALGSEHTSTLAIANNLSLLYRDQGRLAEAEAIFRRANFPTHHRKARIPFLEISNVLYYC